MNTIKQINDYYKINNELDWDRIIDDFTPYINTIIKNMSNDKLTYEDKEEILLDVFFILWKNKENILTSLNSYIAGITRNLVREKCKKKKITYDISNYEDVLTDSSLDMSADERVEILQIENSFKNLKEIDFKIVNMFYYSSKSIKDIAKELNISKFNVANRLSRIRKKIKKQLNIGGKNEK